MPLLPPTPRAADFGGTMIKKWSAKNHTGKYSEAFTVRFIQKNADEIPTPHFCWS
jgi:hypothetical protein